MRRYLIPCAIVLCLIVASENRCRAAQADDKDAVILSLRKALAEEKLERLRLDYLLTKAAHDQITGEIEAKAKAKKDKPDENK